MECLLGQLAITIGVRTQTIGSLDPVFPHQMVPDCPSVPIAIGINLSTIIAFGMGLFGQFLSMVPDQPAPPSKVDLVAPKG